MRFLLKKYSDLSAEESFRLLKLRQDVFIIEQNCIYPDIDGSDTDALHLLLFTDGALAAYSRIFAPGIKFKDASSIGRIVVDQKYRGTDVGRALIQESIRVCKKHYPETSIRIEAQAALKEYYEQYGFSAEGGIYVVDDIDHIQMVLRT